MRYMALPSCYLIPYFVLPGSAPPSSRLMSIFLEKSSMVPSFAWFLAGTEDVVELF